ncbi:hypothetical protein RN001_014532 [Aquatica leii]|uniref:Caspase-1 n=1 Tax=Aquatica leii TaxID=1421715 RepID=A0AAN7SKL1_9COLE|nr:hypothetical protein RN001_014532 [Aquatica leii]
MESSSQNVESKIFKHYAVEDYYPMTKKKLGKVYIFNHMTFKEGTTQIRFAHIRDCKDIEEVFQNLKFDVIKYQNPTYKDVLDKVTTIAEMDYSDYGCLIIFVLTHSKNGKIFAVDTDYYPDVFWNTLNKSSTLMHKPKLILLQCPYDDEDDDVRMQPTGFVPTNYSAPDVPDVLLMYSCFDKFISWRSYVTGSLFIQCLCNEFKQHAENSDVLTILTFLNRTLSLNFEKSRSRDDKDRRNIAIIVSTLDKLLYIGSKNN